jgi:hypothetical protein
VAIGQDRDDDDGDPGAPSQGVVTLSSADVWLSQGVVLGCQEGGRGGGQSSASLIATTTTSNTSTSPVIIIIIIIIIITIIIPPDRPLRLLLAHLVDALHGERLELR